MNREVWILDIPLLLFEVERGRKQRQVAKMVIFYGLLGALLTVILLFIPGLEFFLYFFGATVIFPSFAASTFFHSRKSVKHSQLRWMFEIGAISGGIGAIVSNHLLQSSDMSHWDNVLNRFFHELFKDEHMIETYFLTVIVFILLAEIGSYFAWKLRKRLAASK